MKETIEEVIRLYNETATVKITGLKGVLNKGKMTHSFTNGFGFSALTNGKEDFVLIDKLGLFQTIK